ncbi:ribosome hibernation-promoting factor, HPF/YfiA family [Thermodesulforhabdus norvegica]|uniref:Ribosome hibernation promoting factor n=1 Tax=Thermodesulforhabdus norvegica TaxID=39841 RepID=A0A1I4VJD7_9BACT|nr:ribosome-associated translation inhibitor RaiA [Thermodesulforhabdus norvegica]SFN01235.1 putative sigma-54 modulation protein [Thermodesulforhabdus norvegica]
MQIDFTFRNIEPSEDVKSYVETKIGRVKRYLLEPIEARVVLKAEKYRYIAEISISSNGIRINASEETEDLYSAIDLLADTVESQIKKQLDKMRRRKLSAQERNIIANRNRSSVEGTMGEADEDEYVVFTEPFDPKPIDLDEAILQLNKSDRGFLVFTNQDTGRINVIYRREDGNYGLIET